MIYIYLIINYHDSRVAANVVDETHFPHFSNFSIENGTKSSGISLEIHQKFTRIRDYLLIHSKLHSRLQGGD